MGTQDFGFSTGAAGADPGLAVLGAGDDVGGTLGAVSPGANGVSGSLGADWPGGAGLVVLLASSPLEAGDASLDTGLGGGGGKSGIDGTRLPGIASAGDRPPGAGSSGMSRFWLPSGGSVTFVGE